MHSSIVSLHLPGSSTALYDLAGQLHRQSGCKYLLVCCGGLGADAVYFYWSNSDEEVRRIILREIDCDAPSGTYCKDSDTGAFHYLHVVNPAKESYIECILYSREENDANVVAWLQATLGLHSTERLPGTHCVRPNYGDPYPTQQYSIAGFCDAERTPRSLVEFIDFLYQQHPAYPITVFVQDDSLLRTAIGAHESVQKGIRSFTYSMSCSSVDSDATRFDIHLDSVPKYATAQIPYDNIHFTYHTVGVHQNILDRAALYNALPDTVDKLSFPCNTGQLFDMLNATYDHAEE